MATINDLRRKLLENDRVLFSYRTKTGNLTLAYGTLKGISKHIKGSVRPNEKTFVYFDLTAQGIRSFKTENFEKIYEKNTTI